MLLPIKRIIDRYLTDSTESDFTAFNTLLLMGEFLTKLIAVTLLSGLNEDRDRFKYSVAKDLIKADGIGDWSKKIDLILTGPNSILMSNEYQELTRDLTQRGSEGTWQHLAIENLIKVTDLLGIETQKISDKVALRQWFQIFTELRNKSRGHGALLPAACANAAPHLLVSINAIVEHICICRWQWCYVHRNMSGKYRLTALSQDTSNFNYLKSTNSQNLTNGIYIHHSSLYYVELLFTDQDLSDFLLPNGAYTSKEYAVLSYISGRTQKRDSSPWHAPSISLPASETQGKAQLDLLNSVFTNIPDNNSDYISRPALEARLIDALISDRHEIVTLTGPGGIGKTSLSLTVLHNIIREHQSRFGAVIWFSARDVDLTEAGPKLVKPHGVNIDDFAKELVSLVDPTEREEKTFNKTAYLSSALTEPKLGSTLFVFDNFETVVSPSEIYKFVDTYIRRPNKVIITTRMRDFTGDLAIDVGGMVFEEAKALIKDTAEKLDISNLVSDSYIQELFDEAGGHPYVMKILLGIAKAEGRARKPERIIAAQDHILQALFERTYGAISPGAQHVLHLISSWRSMVPELAVEAVVLTSATDRFDIVSAVDELVRFSLLEQIKSEADGEIWLSIPLSTALFCQKKLTTYPLKAQVETELELLYLLGGAKKSDTRSGIAPRISKMLKAIARKASDGKIDISTYRPMLEYLVGRVPSLWGDLVDLYQEEGPAQYRLAWAKEAMEKAIQSHESPTPAMWRRLASICKLNRDDLGELSALVGLAELEAVPIDELSEIANRVNGLLVELKRTSALAKEVKLKLTSKLISRLTGAATQLDADGLSRLSWLYLNTDQPEKAREYAEMGYDLDPMNNHCMNLLQKLDV